MKKLTTVAALLLVSLLFSVLGLAQVANLNSETVGVPINGDPGVRVSVAEMMKFEKAHPKTISSVKIARKEFEMERDMVLQNPASPQVSSWPPLKLEKNQRMLESTNSPQSVGVSFAGISGSLSPYVPPDIVGDVGPTQIVAHVNGWVKVFDKTGTVGGLNVSDATFWTSVSNGQGVSDPHVRYDRISKRWFFVMINTPATANRIMIAVSSDSVITGSGSFTFFQFTADATNFADYPTLGVDANALYIGTNMFTGAGAYAGTNGYVIKKSALLTGTLTFTKFAAMATASGAGPYTPQGVQNDDPSATEGYFIGGDNVNYGQLDIRRVSTPGGTPTLSANIVVTVPTTAAPMAQVAKGSLTIDALDDRLFAAELHKNKKTGIASLWTAHNIGTDAAGVAAASPTRNAARWYELRNLTSTPILVQSGTLFSAAGTPIGYTIPSVAMSGQGHMALGSTMASTNDYPGIAVAGRYAGDALGSIQAPTIALAGAFAYNAETSGPQRWGDYTQTVVDPTDDMTMWTFQEYCDATSQWALRVVQLLAPAPATPSSVSPSTVNTNATTNVTVTGTSTSGTQFFDPGAGFTRRISASVSGTGVTVNSVTFTDSTHITLNLTIASNATAGTRTITVTNPDGQTATSGAILTINNLSCPTITLTASLPNGAATVAYNQTITATGGTGPYTYAVTSGSLPSGYSLSSGGVLTGTTAFGTSASFTVTASDANTCIGTQAYTLTVTGCPQITVAPASLPGAVIGVAYSQTVTASGGASPYTYAVTSGALPAGLSLSSGGAITGSATTANTYNFTVTATDNNGCTAAQAYSVVAQNCPTITITPGSLTGGTVSTAYSQTLTASGGTASYTYAVTAGSLPAGLALSSGGALTGTPTAAGTSNFTVTATDAGTCTGNQAYSLVISAAVGNFVNLTAGGVASTQDFNTMASTGTTGSTIPTGWLYQETGGGATYTVSTGTGTSGDTYSYGSTSATDRAFGSLASNSLSDTLGAAFVNNTGSTITSLAISFSNEMWRLGATGRTDSSVFGFSTNATNLRTGTWAANTSLNLRSVVTSGTVGALDGNAVANKATRTATISGLSIANGGTFYLRWVDVNVSGSDDGLAVDDFSVTPTVSVTCPTITLAPSTLPAGTNGTSYSQTITASGGTAAYTYAVTTGTLPTGLSLASGGALTGTPTANGTYNFTVTATDANSCTGSQAYSIVVSGGSCPTITLSPSTLPAGTTGTAYNQTITATGGTAAYTYAVTTGTLPTGLSLASGGALTGTPSANGTFNFTVTATDANTCTGSQSYSITVTTTCPTITLSPSTLPNGTVSSAYSQTITATGGTSAYTYTVTAGSLPAGLTLASGGALTGTPSAAGTSNFTVTATDANTCTGTQAYTLVVDAAAATISLTTSGVAYTQDFNTLASTGTTNTTLPAGWLLLETGTNANTSYAADSGSSNSGNTYSYGWTSDRAFGTIASGSVLPTIGAGFTNNTGSTISSLAISFTGEEWRLGVASRTDSLRFSISTDASDLATGTWTRYAVLDVITPNTAATVGKLDGNSASNRAALSTTISGLSIANGATFYIRWADVNITGADDGLAVDDFSITPTTSGCPSITLSPSTLPNGVNGSAYSQTISASGGTAAYTFAVTAGALPTGLSLASGGALTGTPTANGTYNFTVTATDANTCTGTQAYGIAISDPQTNPTVVAGAAPGSVTVGSATLITATVTLGTNPTSTGLAVTANLTPIGGSASQTLYDDGSHGDVTGADNTFSFSATVPGGNATGAKRVAVAVSDAQSRSAVDTVTVTVNPVSCPTITLSPSSVPDGTAGSAYSQTVTASGGASPYTFAVTGGSLPAGVSLASGGALTGTPTVTGAFTFTVTATDNNACTGTKQYTLNLACPIITVSPLTLPGDTVGKAYSQNLSASGGSSPYRFAISAGSVPTGLSLGLRGALTGTLSAVGTFNFTVGVIDTNGCLATQAYSVTVADLPVDTMITVPVAVDAKWNLLSNPVTGVSDSVSYLFPGASSSAYWFSFSGYAQSAQMYNGLGYWLKFPAAHTVNVHGYATTSETLHVFAGWNLIGSASYDIPATDITSNTAVFSSQVFGYNNGYGAATTIKAGKGYWVKATGTNTVVLNAPGAPAKAGRRAASIGDGTKFGRHPHLKSAIKGSAKKHSAVSKKNTKSSAKSAIRKGQLPK